MNKRIDVINNRFESPIVYKHFWSPKVLDNLNEKIDTWRSGKSMGGNLNVQLQYNKWPPRLWGDSGPILLINLDSDKELIEEVKNELNVIYDTSILTRFNCIMHICLKGSYIAWHDDGGHSFVCNTYLNQEVWPWNWGGASIYKDKYGKLTAEFPEYNKMMVQCGHFNREHKMEHATTILSSSSIPRVSFQIFARI